MAKSVKVEDRLAIFERRYVSGDADWKEHLDPTPVEVPTRLKLPQRQVDRVREIVRREMSQAAAAEGFETFAEADDFSLDDGEEWSSRYEEVFEPGIVSGPDGPVKGERHDSTGGKDAVVGGGAASDGVGAGRIAEGSGASGGTAVGAPGRAGGVGGADKGNKGAASESQSR